MSSISNPQPSQGGWQLIAPYVIPPCAASTAVVPVFWGFALKSAVQGGDPFPPMNGAAFATGAVGSVVGHPFDTALTVWQQGRQVTASHLMKGGLIKAVTVGGFFACYTVATEFFTKFSQLDINSDSTTSY